MIHLITGGSASGKSLWAEQQVLDLGEHYHRIYIATMKAWDEEAFDKINRHQQMRKKKRFETIECYTGLATVDLADSEQPVVVLLECMSNLAANEIYDCGGSREEVCDRIMAGVEHLQKQAGHLVIVTNEVFSDGSSYLEETMEYIRTLGLINQRLGQRAQRVTEVVYGIPLTIKDEKKGGSAVWT